MNLPKYLIQFVARAYPEFYIREEGEGADKNNKSYLRGIGIFIKNKTSYTI